MTVINPVAAYTLLNNTTTNVTSYKNQIDANSLAACRLAAQFAPQQSSPAAMTVTLAGGHVFNGLSMNEVTGQVTGTITAPVTHPRIDRVVIDNLTGAVSVITGVEAASPSAPAIPAGKTPVAQVLLQTTSTSITNSMISDERDLSSLGGTPARVIKFQTFTSNGTYTYNPSTGMLYCIVIAVGAGGGAGGIKAASGVAASGGGGAGGCAITLLSAASVGTSQTLTIGLGGAAGPNTGGNGTAGGDTTFGSGPLITAHGGSPGTGSASGAGILQGGLGGGTAGTVNVSKPGDAGGYGFALSATNAAAGNGGSGPFGTGGQGAVVNSAAAASGQSGQGNGAGGGGSVGTSSTGEAGGAGSDGYILIIEFCSQ